MPTTHPAPEVAVGDHVTVTRVITTRAKPFEGATGVVYQITPSVIRSHSWCYGVKLDDGYFTHVGAYDVERIDPDTFRWDPQTASLTEYLADEDLTRAAALHLAVELLPEHSPTEDYIAAATYIETGALTFSSELVGTEVHAATESVPEYTGRDDRTPAVLRKPDHSKYNTSEDISGDSLHYWYTGRGAAFTVVDEDAHEGRTVLVDRGDLRFLYNFIAQILDGQD